jgi:hypothetical protein
LYWVRVYNLRVECSKISENRKQFDDLFTAQKSHVMYMSIRIPCGKGMSKG